MKINNKNISELSTKEAIATDIEGFKFHQKVISDPYIPYIPPIVGSLKLFNIVKRIICPNKSDK